MNDLLTRKYNYQTFTNDPIQVKEYTLSNGMRLFMSVNRHEPRVFSNIVVRAGSKHDPAETTGLAHYMEHMLFKGTSKIGTTDWEREKVLLSEIADLYERHRQTTDETVRKTIYAQIDQLSNEAARLAAPNEYDKLVTALGAEDTNAYTWVEQTVYVNDIPGNELERWMYLESERFRMMALRLFHTELETVYEEFNIGQDRDFRKVGNTLRSLLFPDHPYGTQTTIGSAQHLRNPSHHNIQWYFKTYYVPNNMAIVLAGDFDPDEAVAIAERYFGDYQPQPIPEFHYKEQADIKVPLRSEVWGLESPWVEIGWRFGGSRTTDQLLLPMISDILHNEQAGLLDLNLNQQQKVLEADAWAWYYEDFSAFGLHGKPREEQTLEEVETLLLGEIERIRKGEFEDWMLEAVVRNQYLTEIKNYESNRGRVSALTTAFILGVPWEEYARHTEWLRTVTKAQLVDFVQKNLRMDNFAVVYKRQGPDPNVIKVEKPAITPVELKRDAVSDFARNFLSIQTPRLKPQFADFEGIQQLKMTGGVELDYVANKDNSLFRIDYIFEMGRLSDRHMSLAFTYLPYLGAGKYSAEALQKEWYRLGLSFDVTVYDDRSYLTISGLDESLEAGLELLEYLLANLRGDEQVLENVVSDILVKRLNSKQDRNVILREALASYARYGSQSPFRWRLSEAELNAVHPDDLTGLIQGLCSYEHRIYYYGPRSAEAVAGLLQKHHPVKGTLRKPLPAKIFSELDTHQNQVIFLDFPIVQTDLLFLSKGTPNFNLEEYKLLDLYNEYFGFGLSSIVFQEIRESKALAYHTYAYYTSPTRYNRAHYLQAYVGTQPDKLTDALPALRGIIEQMPVVEPQIEQARASILKRIESERTHPSRLYWDARAAWDLGFRHDLQREVYDTMVKSSAADLQAFHEQYIKGRAFTFLVMGERKALDFNYLNSIGEVKELSIEEAFGH
ncbi:MAG: insulinase family protein [Saprospiraceae bacterium]|nr:insulinase family protein [Saprospiraceae bacterium]